MAAFKYFSGTVVVFLILITFWITEASLLPSRNTATDGNISTQQHLMQNQQIRQKRANGLFELINTSVGFISGILTIYGTVKAELATSVSDELAGQFSSLEKGLGEIKDDIRKVINAVREESVRNQYFDEEKAIDASVNALVAYLEHRSTAGESPHLLKRFLGKAATLEDNINNLMKGLVGSSSLGGDIVLALSNGVDCDEKKFRQQIGSVIRLINVAFCTHAAYAALNKLTDAETRHFKSRFERNYKEIQDKVEREALGCRSESKVVDEMRRIMRDKSSLNNEQMAQELLKFLSNKYSSRKWFVMVYNEIGGFDKHCMSHKFHTVFREGGKNAAAHSSDANEVLNDQTTNVLKSNVESVKTEKRYITSVRGVAQYGPIESAESAYDIMKRNANSADAAVVKRFVDLKATGSTNYFMELTERFTIIALPSSSGPVDKVHATAAAFSAAPGGDSSLEPYEPLPCNKRLVGYVSSWGIKDISMQQANLLTHMIFAFIEMRADGSLVVGSADPSNSEATASKSEARLRQLMDVKAKTGFRLKTLFAVGGWENSQHFSATAASAQLRSNFIRDVLVILQKYNFDGVDIDWEYPVTGGAQEGTASDKENYIIFLKEIRDRMAALQRSEGRADPYLLTIASAAGSWVLDVGYDLEKTVDIVDWINVMTYDYFGAWESKWGAYTGPPAPLYHGTPKGFSGKMNADYTLKYYVCNTKRPDKIVMGVPFYGRYWYNVGNAIDAGDSLWRLAEPNNQHRYEGGFSGWRDIETNWLNRDGYESVYHEKTATPYLWSATNRALLAYDNARSLKAKVQYAASHSLGGVMIWAIDLDNDRDDLLRSVRSAGICSPEATLGYRCNPLGKEKRWWTPEDNQPEKAGMCGRMAPLYKGFYPVCDPDDPGYGCCGQWGYCGGDSAFCDCPNCVNYILNPERLTEEPVKPSGAVRWHTLDSKIVPGTPRCGRNAALKLDNGLFPICNPDDPGMHCCSPAGYCGNTNEFCECEGCTDFKKMSDSAINDWMRGLVNV